jgi:hypothetical protein
VNAEYFHSSNQTLSPSGKGLLAQDQFFMAPEVNTLVLSSESALALSCQGVTRTAIPIAKPIQE